MRWCKEGEDKKEGRKHVCEDADTEGLEKSYPHSKHVAGQLHGFHFSNFDSDQHHDCGQTEEHITAGSHHLGNRHFLLLFIAIPPRKPQAQNAMTHAILKDESSEINEPSCQASW